MAGRLSIIELGPLRLYEIAGIRGSGRLLSFAPDGPLEDWAKREFWLDVANHAKANAKDLRQAFQHFSHLGGYPRCHGTKAGASLLGPQIVRDVVDRTIEHDLTGTGSRPPDTALVREVFRIVCRNAGRAVRPRVIAQEVGNLLQKGVTDGAVGKCVQFLVDAMLVHQVLPLELLHKKQSQPPKLCLCDHFVRNVWLQETVPLTPAELATAHESVATLAGSIMESVVGYYLKGIPSLEVAWFPQRPQEPEVDFVLTVGMQRIPIEVKYRRGGLQQDDFRGLHAFCDNTHYRARFGLVITQDIHQEIDERTLALPASAFLLAR